MSDHEPSAKPAANPFKQARTSAGLTQQQVAAKLGVRHATVVAWEKGANPQPETLPKLAALYGVDAAQLRWPETSAAGVSDEGAPSTGSAAALTGVVLVPGIALGRIIGRLETTVEMMRSMDESVVAIHAHNRAITDSMGEMLNALRAQISGATTSVASGVESLRDAGVLRPGERFVEVDPARADAVYQRMLAEGRAVLAAADATKPRDDERREASG